VWHHLRGIDNPDLVSPLLHQLANDPDERARESAASLLGEYLDYAGVRSALEEAALNETSRSARRAARSSLGQIDQ
jgi:HEAT repeat protein